MDKWTSLWTHLVSIGINCGLAVPYILTLGYVAMRSRRSTRRNPLTRDLMRPPGHSLRMELRAIDEEQMSLVFALMSCPVFVFSIHVTQSYFFKQPETITRIVLGILFVAGFVWEGSRRLLKNAKRVHGLALGLQGELATAAELNQLMLHGCRVFHDVPAEHGNIDHVVVSPRGVFAVNTKMRGKPNIGEHSEKLIVYGDTNELEFPDGRFPIPVGQLEGESRWLRDFLSDSVGRKIDVEPIVAFPGWFVERRGDGWSKRVINPHKAHSWFIGGEPRLSAEVIQQIAHQLDQRCRDVEPVFRKKSDWLTDKPRSR